MILMRRQATVRFVAKISKNLKNSKMIFLAINILGFAFCHASIKKIDPSCPLVFIMLYNGASR